MSKRIYIEVYKHSPRRIIFHIPDDADLNNDHPYRLLKKAKKILFNPDKHIMEPEICVILDPVK